LHWLIAVLIIGAFTLGLVMTDIPGLTPTKLRYFSWHKWAGVTVLLLATLRLLWRLRTARRPIPPRCRLAARAAHGLHGTAVCDDVRRAAVRLFLQPGGRRAGGVLRPVPAAGVLIEAEPGAGPS
jgi:hypothetical protein